MIGLLLYMTRMNARVLDDMVVNMVDVGEETGELDTMLYKVADNYDDEVAVLTESLMSLMEPLLIICSGRHGGVHRHCPVPAAHCPYTTNSVVVDGPVPALLAAKEPAMNRKLECPVSNPADQAVPGGRISYVCSVRGFTLVELLVVITIIGVLAALISVAGGRVRRTVVNARMKSEVMLMQDALVAFKERFGMFPPDGTNNTATQQFLATAFPRYTGRLPSSVTITPSTALYFWLGNGPNGLNPPGGLAGFSANPTNPFDSNPARIGPFFNFDTGRVRSISGSSTGACSYYPDNGLTSATSTSTTSAPYLYFVAVNNSYTSSYSLTYRLQQVGVGATLYGRSDQQHYPGQPDDVPDPLPRPGRPV